MNAAVAINNAHERCRTYLPATPSMLVGMPYLARLLTEVLCSEHLYFFLSNFLFHYIIHVLISNRI
jgi:hypothetical protein